MRWRTVSGVGDGFKPSRGGGAGGAHTCTTLAVTQDNGRDMSRPYITQHHPTRFRRRGYGLRVGRAARRRG